MSRNATIQGPVAYRLGEGPLLRVPRGEVELEIGRGDVTLSWSQGQTRRSAAMPSTEFARYVAEGAIVLEPV